MPNCRYIVLSYHPAETSKGGHPLVLLLEYADEHRSRKRKNYLLSDFGRVAEGMSSEMREWIAAVLMDISSEQFQLQMSPDELFGWYSYLNVGPLRTTCLGHFSCDSISEAFASIKEDVVSQAPSSEGGRYFPDLLTPLDGETLRSSGWLPQGQSQLNLRQKFLSRPVNEIGKL